MVNEYEAGYQTGGFVMTIDGVELARFTRVSGLSYTVEPIPAEAKNAEGQLVRYKVPGRTTYSPLHMTRPLTSDNALLEWHNKTIGEGDTERKTGEIAILDRAGERRGAWTFEGALLSSWQVSGAAAGSDDLLDEMITINVDRIYRSEP